MAQILVYDEVFLNGATKSKTCAQVELKLKRSSSALRSQLKSSICRDTSPKAKEKASLVISRDRRVEVDDLDTLNNDGNVNKTVLWSEKPFSQTSRSHREKP